ncbi:MAG: FGGY family carbohydrate kinase [Robiginitalea sp.]
MSSYFIGYDLGSSSLKTALIAADTGDVLALVKTPAEEMEIRAPQAGWAEQDPEFWWECLCKGTREILHKTNVPKKAIRGIGIAYQMHGLVPLNSKGKVVRPSIIWCDSRAVTEGEVTAREVGEEVCRSRLLNEPGNFTASKLRWMQRHEPDLFRQTQKILLPGDYIAYRLSGQMQTTASGLSEGILWDFSENQPAYWLLEHWGIPGELIPEVVPAFGFQAAVSETAARATGLAKGTPVLYRAGDQPNNAFTLNVLEPGELAATAGTSGVLYGVTDRKEVRELKRFNHFLHVNNQPDKPRIGQLLCINGAGIAYRWLKQQWGIESYNEMNALAMEVPAGSGGLLCHPFGNGAERLFENRESKAALSGIDFNRHHTGHLCRAVLEGVAYAFRYGMEVMEAEGVRFQAIRAGNDNLFQAGVFTTTLAALSGKPVELYEVTGAVGAARACLVAEKGLEKRIGKTL